MSASKSSLISVLFASLSTIGCGSETKSPPVHPIASVEPSPQAREKIPETMVCAEITEPSSKDIVSKIEVQGEGIPKELCSLIQSMPGRPVDEARVDADVRAIWGDGRVDDVIVSRQEQEQTSLLFHVRMLPRVVSFEIQGADSRGAFAEDIRFERPAFASRARLSAETKRVEQDLRDAGWTSARVSYEITPKGEGEAAVVVRAELGSRLVVRRIRIEGPSPSRADELRALLGTSPNQPLDKLVLARDVLVIQADGYDRGLVTTSVSEPELVSIEDGKAVEIVLRVNEGDVYRLGKLSFAGDLIEPAKRPEKKLWTTAKGAIFSRKVIAADVDKIRTYYESRGKNVDVVPETTLDPAHKTIDVTIRIKENR